MQIIAFQLNPAMWWPVAVPTLMVALGWREDSASFMDFMSYFTNSNKAWDHVVQSYSVHVLHALLAHAHTSYPNLPLRAAVLDLYSGILSSREVWDRQYPGQWEINVAADCDRELHSYLEHIARTSASKMAVFVDVLDAVADLPVGMLTHAVISAFCRFFTAKNTNPDLEKGQAVAKEIVTCFQKVCMLPYTQR